MYEIFSSYQIVLLSENSSVIDFFTDAFSTEFQTNIIRDINQLTSHFSLLAPLLIIDCVFFDRKKAHEYFFKIISAAKDFFWQFKGNIMFLVHSPLLNTNTLKKIVPHGSFILFPCAPHLYRTAILQKLTALDAQNNLFIDKTKNSHAEEISGFEKLIGNSPEIHETKKRLKKFSSSDNTILMLGESGTGKSFAAEIVHKNSTRRKNKFVAVNMAAVPESIAESTLFGTVPGAFTGAGKHAGHFSEANGGTLFMDEIAEMPLSLQSKLLTVLDKKKFYSVGADKETKVDVRIICATNANLIELIRAGKFRKDLYWRISHTKIFFPPLRYRKNDIELLIEWMLLRYDKKISKRALKKLESYSWPGNIRQLYNCMENACVICHDRNIIEPDDIYFDDDFEL